MNKKRYLVLGLLVVLMLVLTFVIGKKLKSANVTKEQVDVNAEQPAGVTITSEVELY